MRLGMIVQDGNFGSAVASMIDILRIAEASRAEVDPTIDPIELDLAATHRRVQTTTSMTVHADHSLRNLVDHDLIIIPALGALTHDTLLESLGTADTRAVIRMLGNVDPSRTRIAAGCTGTFVVAEAGLADDRRATTSWFLGPSFRKRYPSVDLDLDAMVVADGNIVTAGAAFAHIDLALAIVRSISPDLAHHVAKLLLIDDRPSQAAFVAYDHLSHDDPIVVDFERHVRANLDQPFDIAIASAAIGTSRRTLERRIKVALNMTPLGFVRKLRIERARHLANTTELSTADIALRVGYANAETLRALLRSER